MIEQYYMTLMSSVFNLNYDLITEIIKCIVNMTCAYNISLNSYTVKTYPTQSLLN